VKIIASKFFKLELNILFMTFVLMEMRLEKVKFFMGEGKGKGTTIPLQAWTGPKGSRRLRLPDFKTIDT
jgi:hypothetical protein